MAEVVLVHGIGQQQECADTLEKEWVQVLARGVHTAGFPDLADRLAARQVDTMMAFYGDVFLRPGAQGDDIQELTDEEAKIAQMLAAEWLARAAGRSQDPQANQLAAETLEVLTGESVEAMGFGNWMRRMVRGIGEIKWFAPTGFALAERFVNRSLKQISAYLANKELKEEIQSRVSAVIDDSTRAIVGHSLGSVVAYEVVAKLDTDLPLLVTLGSPLGLGTVVFDKVQPQPPSFPSSARLWVNVADTDDLVAADPDLSSKFGASMPEGAEFRNPPVDNGAQPHSAKHYLTKAVVGEPIAEKLEGGLP